MIKLVSKYVMFSYLITTTCGVDFKAIAQNRTTGASSTSGPCSPGVTDGNTIVINVKDCNISSSESKQILKMLQLLLSQNKERDAKLNELVDVASRPTVAIGGSVLQIGGDCTQNVVGGSNNITNCAPKPFDLTAMQAKRITDSLLARGASGSVEITVEMAAPNGRLAAGTLAKALSDAHLIVTTDFVGMNISCDSLAGGDIPGLSLDCVDIKNPLSQALAQAFIDADVFKKTVPASPPLSASGNSLVKLLIRKP